MSSTDAQESPTLKRARVDESISSTTANEPRIIVYVTPRPLTCMTQNYMPPEEDCALIRKLWAHNVNPQLNGSAQPTMADVKSCVGYVLVEGSHLIDCQDYTADLGRVTLLHWYASPVSRVELEVMHPLWAAFYGLGLQEYTLPTDYNYLVERGMLGRGTTPPQVSKEVFEPVGILPEEESSNHPSISCA